MRNCFGSVRVTEWSRLGQRARFSVLININNNCVHNEYYTTYQLNLFMHFIAWILNIILFLCVSNMKFSRHRHTLRREVLCSAYEVIPFHLSVLHFIFFFAEWWALSVLLECALLPGISWLRECLVLQFSIDSRFYLFRTSTTNFGQFSLVWPFPTSRANKLFWRQYESIFIYHFIRLTIECILESDQRRNNWKNIQIFECHKTY